MKIAKTSLVIKIFLLIFCSNARAQVSYTFQKFSDVYGATVKIDDTSQVFSPGTITINNKKTNATLLTLKSDELALELHDGKALANIKQLPYGEQSLIIYEDFNFDGEKDLAVQDGQNSCYHGPSYKVFLSQKGKLVFNKAFTRLAQEYCGMFQADAGEKKLYTMTKDGCCWHQFSTFVVENNAPKAVLISEEQITGALVNAKEKEWANGKFVTRNQSRLMADSVLYTFKLAKNGKRLLLAMLDNNLYYALEKPDKNIEMIYPSANADQTFVLTRNGDEDQVTFTNNDASYTIYDDGRKLGVRVLVNGKVIDMPGQTDTRAGQLSRLRHINLENVQLSR